MVSHDIWGVLGMSTHLITDFYQVTGDLTIQNDIFYAKNLGSKAPGPSWANRQGQVVRFGEEAKHCVPGVPSTVWSQEWCEAFHRPIGAISMTDGKSRVASKCMPWTSLVPLKYLGCSSHQELKRTVFSSSHVDGQNMSKPFYQHVSNLYSTWFCLFGQYICEDDGRGI